MENTTGTLVPYLVCCTRSWPSTLLRSKTTFVSHSSLVPDISNGTEYHSCFVSLTGPRDYSAAPAYITQHIHLQHLQYHAITTIMAVARLVSLFEGKTLDHPEIPHIDSFASRSLRASPIMPSEDTFCISVQPYHFSNKRASRQRYYDSNESSPSSSPSSSCRSHRQSYRSVSPMSSGLYTPTRRRFSSQLRLRRIPSHVDLALAAERDEHGLELLEPRPVPVAEAACLGRSGSPSVMLDGIFEVLEGH